jgi:YspA, cpYpsA-related SLOG family
MKTIIAGSRPKYWPENFDYMSEINLAVANSRFAITEVVSGTAQGFDLWGEKWAQGVGIPVVRFPANWNKHGNKAGFLRNETMAQYAGAAIVAWDGSSKGSKHMIDIARRWKLKVYVHIPGVVTNETTGLVDINSSTANMYGCQPCPRCGSTKRCVFCAEREHITCDDCQFMEPITQEVF